MELALGVTLPDAVLRSVTRRHGIVRLSLSAMERELESVIGRRVDLRTVGDLSRHFRDAVASGARLLYAA